MLDKNTRLPMIDAPMIRRTLLGYVMALVAVGCASNEGTADNAGASAGQTSTGGAVSAGQGGGLGSSGAVGSSGSSAGQGSSNGGASGSTGGSGSGGSTGGAPIGPPKGADGKYVCTGTKGGLASARRLTPSAYRNAITDVFTVAGSDKYPGTYGQSVTGYSTEPGISAISEQGVEQLMIAAEEVAQLVAPKLASILPCTSTGNEACATTYLNTVGRLAFRRDLSAAEKTSLLAVYTAERADSATFAEAIAVMTAQLLQMPGFLYVLEAPSPAGMDRKLTSAEIASRLAMHFWDSVPDAALLTLAANNGLAEKAAVATEAERLFKDSKSNRGFARFFREWTETVPLTIASKDAQVFPYYNASFVTSVNTAFDMFVADQVRSGGTLRSLLTSTRTFVDKNLATFYGLPAVNAFTQVDLPADRYAGITTQPAMLAALSSSGATAYIFRGRYVRRRLLCQTIGAPPGNAMAEFAALPKPVDPTGKELSAVIRANPVCAGCHGLLDPAGLAYEHFDAMGKYRAAYTSNKAIDTTGTVVAAGTMDLAFDSPVDMMADFASLEVTRQCFAKQVFRYTVSRPDSDSDVCGVQQIDDALIAADGKLDRAFLTATQTDAFLYRRGE